MKLSSCALALFVGLTPTAYAQDDAPKDAPQMETVAEKASYQIGMNIGANLRRQGLPIDPELVAHGLISGLKGEKSVLSPEEIEQVFAAMDAEMRKLQETRATRNLASGRKFLEENKAKEGIKVTDSGLQYKVITEGSGTTPTPQSTVTTHYRGKLIDGTIFDASYTGDEPTDDDQPISFGVTQVIRGWTEALQLMKVGAHYQLFIPSELAYGENGPGEIGPNSVLMFDIYLVGVK